MKILNQLFKHEGVKIVSPFVERMMQEFYDGKAEKQHGDEHPI